MLSSVGVFPSRNQSAFIFSIASLIASSSGERYRPVVATEACPMAACTTLTLISVRALTAKVCLSQWVDEARSLGGVHRTLGGDVERDFLEELREHDV